MSAGRLAVAVFMRSLEKGRRLRSLVLFVGFLNMVIQAGLPAVTRAVLGRKAIGDGTAVHIVIYAGLAFARMSASTALLVRRSRFVCICRGLCDC